MSERRALIIAGPNGAGKTTFARAFRPEEAHCPRFIIADLIAAGFVAVRTRSGGRPRCTRDARGVRWLHRPR